MFGFLRRWFDARRQGPADSGGVPADGAESGAIRGCRERFGRPPRALAGPDAEACRLHLNPHLASLLACVGDPLLRIPDDQPALCERGDVVWGQLVQANAALFDPANHRTLPANVVYSTDPYFDGRPTLLGEIGRGLFARKGSVPADPDLREFVRVVTDEHERIMRRELPRRYCGGRSVYFATCLVQPGHLPGNCLAGPAFPLVVSVPQTTSVMVLPARFWPARLVARWRAAAPKPPTDPHPAGPPGAADVALTPAAAQRVRAELRETGWRYLRVAVEVAEVRDGVPVAFRKAISVVARRGADDVVVESEGVTILVDSLSAGLFAGDGEVIDWAAGADGRAGFKFRSTEGG